MSELLIIAVGITFLFAYINGFHDGCNVIATIIGSRSMKARRALIWATIAEFVGPLVMGTAVALTVASAILKPELLLGLDADDMHRLIIAAVGGAIFWNIFTWIVGMPSSSSHALIGGMMGAGVITMGEQAIAVSRLLYGVVLPLFISPILGFIAGSLLFYLVQILFSRSHRSIAHVFIAIQKPGMFFLAASHGSNDAQKSMGVIALALVAGTGEQISVPPWVVVGCAAAIALGMSTGGWTIIKTVGYGIFRMQPVHSFCSQTASAGVIIASSIIGGPVSTTQVVASSVLGVGATKRMSGVRWSVVRNIAYAWFLTIPVSAAVGAVFCRLLIWFYEA